MKYVIPYEHLKYELVRNESTAWHFENVKKEANEHKLELSDDDFKRFFQISIRGKDVSWLMHQMSSYKSSLTDALVTYITYSNY